MNIIAPDFQNTVHLSSIRNENHELGLSKGIIANYEASVSKLFGSEVAQHVANTGMVILGPFGLLEPDSKWVRLKGEVERLLYFPAVPVY